MTFQYVSVAALAVFLCVTAFTFLKELPSAVAMRQDASEEPDDAAVQQSRKRLRMLDQAYKQLIALITEECVHDTGDAGPAVQLFAKVSQKGTHQVRLLDMTGQPRNPENVPHDAFEQRGVQRLKAGAAIHERVVGDKGKHQLRAISPVSVIMQKCVMCHTQYADVERYEPIGAISYIIPID